MPLFLVAITGWILYISYFTVDQLGNVLQSFRFALDSLVYDGAVNTIAYNTSRAYDVWAQIVSLKSIYFLILILLGISLSFVNAYRKRNEVDKLVFTILLISTVFFGGVAIGLGGAGYLERLPSAMLPLIIYSILKFGSNLRKSNSIFSLRLFRHHKFAKMLVIIPLVLAILLGGSYHVTGRNLQSFTYGAPYGSAFIDIYSPYNIDNLYPGLNIINIKNFIIAEQSNNSITDQDVITINRRLITETFYYIDANMSSINNSISSLYQEMSIVYSNPDTTILMQTNK